MGAVSKLIYPDVKEGVFSYMIIKNLNPVMAGIVISAVPGAAMFWKGANRKGAVSAIFTGGIIGAGSILRRCPRTPKGWINTDLGLFYAYIASLAVLIIVSLVNNKSYKQ